MLLNRPMPAPPAAEDAPFWSRDWRPRSELTDAIVPLLYYFFASAACYDSAWGMLLTAEWGVRAGTVPADMYHRFIRHLEPDPENEATKNNTMWVFRFFEPRAAHIGLPTRGLFSTEHAGLNLGFAQSPAWDPFYFVDRTVSVIRRCRTAIASRYVLPPFVTRRRCSVYSWLRSRSYTSTMESLPQPSSSPSSFSCAPECAPMGP
jgi:hypothetical protein